MKPQVNNEAYTDRFCSSHCSLSQSSRQTFILHRNILHSILLPVLQIQSQAATFAEQTLSRQWHSRQSKPSSPTGSPPFAIDLEVAFRGAARGSFSWLQCFVAEEREWCNTEGCPACVVLQVLHSEPFIRIVVASCRLSSHLGKPLGGAASSPPSPTSSLPSFNFWEGSVRRAVADDEFWGLHFWEDIESRAQDLETGIRDLIRQGCEIKSMSPRQQLSSQRRAVTFGAPSVTSPEVIQDPAKQQLRLRKEEQAWLRQIDEACWAALVEEAATKRKNSTCSSRKHTGPSNHRHLTA